MRDLGKPASAGGLLIFHVAGLAGLIAGVWILFATALPGILQFDDKANLSGLARIRDWESGWRWIRDGNAGPTGRPLSLATFALQYAAWPDPAPLLRWNIALHLLNALLVLWLSMLVGCRLWWQQGQQFTIGLMVALTWAVLPFLNTSVLFIVQRMTLLSATFTLAGLIAYLKLRGPADASWLRQTAALLALGACGMLALLAKESGALIVVYVLVLELLVLESGGRRRLSPSALLLIIANAVLLLALLRYARWEENTQLTRGYDMPDRLGSQGLMLLVYLKGLFLPLGSDLNPFRFDQLLRSGGGMRWGIAVWLLLMAAPVFVWLRGWRLAALALGWFFYGHIMESGWLSLEPYFAHRNYLPAIGLVFAICAGVFSLRNSTWLWRGAYVLYVVALALVTWMNTSLWGNRMLAAEIWAREEPQSIRAALNLGYELERTQGLGAAQQYLDRFIEQGRDSTGLRLQSLVSACTLDPETDHSKLVHSTTHAIQTLPYEGWATDQMEKLLEKVQSHRCTGVRLDQVAQIAHAFLGRAAYQSSKPVVHNLLSVLGFIALDQGHPREALDFFMQALEKSMSYSIAGLCLHLARSQDDVETIRNLQSLAAKSAAPRGVTPKEWQALRGRIAAALP